jgi:hypothetical protein
MTAQSMQMTCRLLPYPASELRAELWVLRTMIGRMRPPQQQRHRYSAVQCSAVQCTALHCTALHCTAPYRTAPHCSPGRWRPPAGRSKTTGRKLVFQGNYSSPNICEATVSEKHELHSHCEARVSLRPELVVDPALAGRRAASEAPFSVRSRLSALIHTGVCMGGCMSAQI